MLYQTFAEAVLNDYYINNLTTLQIALKYDVEREDVLMVLENDWLQSESMQ